MMKLMFSLSLLIGSALTLLGQCPWPDPADCAGKCDTCTNPMPPETCYYCASSGQEVGYTCKVTKCNSCTNGSPICSPPPGAPKGAIATKATAKCSRVVTAQARAEMAKENAGWTSNKDLGAKLPQTAAEALEALQDWVKTTAIKGTAQNPAMATGHLLNLETHESTQWHALNVKPGVWELHVEKAIYGESVLPDKITVSVEGLKTK